MRKYRLMFCILFLLGTVLAVEIALRLKLGLGNPPLFQRDAEIGYLLAPNQEVYRVGNRVSINGYHQRADALAPMPRPGVARLMFLGDSITFGIAAIDQSNVFSEQVGRELRAHGQNVEIANASAASWGIGNEYAYINRFGTFGSQIAILQIGSSDLLQPKSTGDRVGIDPNQPDRKPLLAIDELVRRFLIPRFLDFAGLAERPNNEPVSEADREAIFSENMRYFTQLVARVRAGGTQPVVLLVPGLPEIIPIDGAMLTRYNPYRDRFKEIARSLNVPLIDLAADFQRETNVARFYADGTHLTLDGNRAVSESIVRNLNDASGSLAHAGQSAIRETIRRP